MPCSCMIFSVPPRRSIHRFVGRHALSRSLHRADLPTFAPPRQCRPGRLRQSRGQYRAQGGSSVGSCPLSFWPVLACRSRGSTGSTAAVMYAADKALVPRPRYPNYAWTAFRSLNSASAAILESGSSIAKMHHEVQQYYRPSRNLLYQDQS